MQRCARARLFDHFYEISRNFGTEPYHVYGIRVFVVYVRQSNRAAREILFHLLFGNMLCVHIHCAPFPVSFPHSYINQYTNGIHRIYSGINCVIWLLFRNRNLFFFSFSFFLWFLSNLSHKSNSNDFSNCKCCVCFFWENTTQKYKHSMNEIAGLCLNGERSRFFRNIGRFRFVEYSPEMMKITQYDVTCLPRIKNIYFSFFF